MNVLALDSSALTASAAVTRDGAVLAEAFINAGLTHSETLAPLVQKALDEAGLGLFDMDVIAVTNGPGSFTGVRIGVALAKGLAQPMEIPCFGVSTLEAAAFRFRDTGKVILACMDARREQVYCALFRGCGAHLERLTPDEALSADEAVSHLLSYGEAALICGDGTPVAVKSLARLAGEKNAPVTIPEGDEIYQRASGAALAAEYALLYTDKTPVAAKFLNPTYLRLPQAERELRAKQSEKRSTQI